MNFLPRLCALLLALVGVASANPFSNADASIIADASLRLIKVSESDPGTWVREDEKIEKYVAKGINFVDVTNMTVGEPSCIMAPARPLRCGMPRCAG